MIWSKVNSSIHSYIMFLVLLMYEPVRFFLSFSKYFYSVIHLDTALFISNEHLYTWEVIFLVLLGGQSWDRVLVAQFRFRDVMK